MHRSTSHSHSRKWPDAVVIAAGFLLVVALLFGGASRQHELRLAVVELAALPLAVLALHNLARRGDLAAHRFSLTLAAALAGLPLIQLLPLPPALWTALPGRDPSALALDLLGLAPSWLPISLTPDKTWASFLALLPPLAMFLGLLAMPARARVLMVYGLLAGTLAAILLGTAQLASGGERLYLWATVQAGTMAGFFANRNHLATLCLIAMPFATVVGVSAWRRGRRMPLWFAILFIALTAVALAAIRSRAGIILFGPILCGSVLTAWVSAGRGRPGPQILALIGGTAMAVTAVGVFAAAPLLERFDSGGTPEGRFENWPVVAEAAQTYLPLGSGVGSFDSVYRSVEPIERLDATYFNQAHNDYLETWLEAGWPGAALIIAFVIWFGRRTWSAWRAEASTQHDLQRASTIAITAILLHTTVDYPLRTAAIATIFALCCAVLESCANKIDVKTGPRLKQVR